VAGAQGLLAVCLLCCPAWRLLILYQPIRPCLSLQHTRHHQVVSDNEVLPCTALKATRQYVLAGGSSNCTACCCCLLIKT
jgi:hypothetical protein